MDGQLDIFTFLAENYKLMPDNKINIEGVINIDTLSDFTVQSTYRDIFLIINMLDDYVNMLKHENSVYVKYMIQQFERISKELSEQICLDKEKMYKRCQKKREKAEKDDVGGDAFNLLVATKLKFRSMYVIDESEI